MVRVVWSLKGHSIREYNISMIAIANKGGYGVRVIRVFIDFKGIDKS